MKKIQFKGLIYLSCLLLVFSACKEDGIDQSKLDAYGNAYEEWTKDPRGELVEHRLERSWTAIQVDSILDSYGDPTLEILTPSYGVDLYKVTHKTIDAKGEEIVEATGLTVVPTGTSGPIGIAAYQHGTTLRKSGVPSALADEHNIGIILASQAGIVISMSDYLGLGDGAGLHPYIHAKSEATCGVDMLRATKTLCGEIGQELTDKLLLFGYSQGGHAAMAMHKEIQEKHSGEFTVTASAPMAGPYDVSGYQAEIFITPQPYDAPYYLPYILLAYNEVYGLFDFPSDFLASPYDQTIPPLFNGLNGGGSVNNEMPPIPIDIIKPEFLNAFKYNYDHPFRAALRDNDLYNWTPKAPVLLCHCEGDNLVRYENSLVAYNSFLERGANVELTNPGNQDHSGCVFPCLLQGFIWFDQFLEE